jgi:hypothetical protein
MKKLLDIAAGALLGILLLAVPQAHAQDAPIMALDPTLMAGWSGNLAYGNKVSGKANAAVKTNFTYTTTPALRQQVVATFAKRLQAKSPQGAYAVNTTFGPGKADYDAFYRQMLSKSSLLNNNVADALTGLILVSYQIVNNISGAEINSAMESMARTQIASILAKNPKITSEATRAQMGEEMKLQSVVMVLGLQESAKTNTEQAYRQSIANMFQKQYGSDLTKMTLTNQGFVKKK